MNKNKYNNGFFCSMALEITNTILKISKIVDYKFIGDMKKEQIIMINEKPVFIYLPIKTL